MKKLKVFLVSVLATAALNAAVIEQVIVRQQWPWSTDVKIEYKISAVTNPVDITVQAFNGATELALPAEAITGDRYGITEDGVGTLVIDPVKAFGAEKVALANFKVRLVVADSEVRVTEVLYKIFDLRDGSCKDVTRADFLNGRMGAYETDFSKMGPDFNTSLSDVLIWTGVTNVPAYKTTHLVMRKIPAAGKSFAMGSRPDQIYKRNDEKQHNVSFGHDFYIAVFELTEAQYAQIGCKYESKGWFKGASDAAMRPITRFIYGTQARGDGKTSSTGNTWPGDNHKVHDDSFFAVLQRLTGVSTMDFPTEAQWEYACRAGTATMWNCGRDHPTPDNKKFDWTCTLCRMCHTTPTYTTLVTTQDITAEEGGTAVVGSYLPNAWGLYDMHGNVAEWCLDHYAEDISGYVGPDPVGPDSTANLIRRGGCYNQGPIELYSSFRSSAPVYNDSQANGCRVCFTVTQ